MRDRRVKLVLAAMMLSGPAMAERVECRLAAPCPDSGICVQDIVPLAFEIDRNQFAAPVDSNEPPRNKVTHVDLGGVRFAAEPMIIGDTLGFWEDAEAMGERMFTLGSDGIGLYTEWPAGVELSGECVVHR